MAAQNLVDLGCNSPIAQAQKALRKLGRKMVFKVKAV